jgi:cell wall assembly regulator SMI1
MPKPQTSIAKSWARIHKALSAVDTNHLQSLEKPVKPEAVVKLEATFGASLPADFKESLFIHDGQKSGVQIGVFPGFYNDDIGGSYYLMDSNAIARDWKSLRAVQKAGDFDDLAAEADRGVASAWWDESWIPFAANGGGDYFCIDLKPARGGSVGQIVSFEGKAGRRRLVAKSFSIWLSRQAKAFEAGELPDLE